MASIPTCSFLRVEVAGGTSSRRTSGTARKSTRMKRRSGKSALGRHCSVCKERKQQCPLSKPKLVKSVQTLASIIGTGTPMAIVKAVPAHAGCRVCSVLVVAANSVPTQLRDFSQGEASRGCCFLL